MVMMMDLELAAAWRCTTCLFAAKQNGCDIWELHLLSRETLSVLGLKREALNDDIDEIFV